MDIGTLLARHERGRKSSNDLLSTTIGCRKPLPFIHVAASVAPFENRRCHNLRDPKSPMRIITRSRVCAARKLGFNMKKSDVTCSECHADFQRIELLSLPGIKGEFNCPVCSAVLEIFDGNRKIVYRLMIQPDGPRKIATSYFQT
jgi:hypothetical protein